MNEFVQVLLFGLTLGGVYALMASGLTLVFGVMRIVNLDLYHHASHVFCGDCRILAVFCPNQGDRALWRINRFTHFCPGTNGGGFTGILF